MRLKSRVGIAASVLFLGAAALFWWSKSERPRVSQRGEPGMAGQHASPPAAKATANDLLAAAAAKAAAPSAKSHHLSNTSRTMAELERDSRAVLLRNASIDTGSTAKLQIPESLKADQNPGSYIVHSRHGLDQGFYTLLHETGAEFISYIPNDSALVKATAAEADQLRGNWTVESVLPYEPYFKLDPSLIPAALGEKPLSASYLGITAFPSTGAAVRSEIPGMGLEIVSEERTPFGTEFIVSMEKLTAAQASQAVKEVARNAGVMNVEPSVKRMFLNDLTRPRIGVAVDSLVSTNYQNLTGSNVIVAVNDGGIDATHPDLVGRVFAAAGSPSWLLTDSNTSYGIGHGTHVAGILAGNGSQSTTVSNAPGSVRETNGAYVMGQFRGMAPSAKLLIQPVDIVTGPLISDTYLQETAAKSNAFICNNSWGYTGEFGYTMSAASYDAATRDALPNTNGSQPLLFVFAAGNEGSGNNDGTGGRSDSILSPATAKNVITVGALEALRYITNEVHITNSADSVNGTNITTNAVWKTATDSDYQVARFSSRGNVGIGIEGQFGRVKPDVVAPGVFALSTRSASWTNPVAGATVDTIFDRNQVVMPGATVTNVVTVPSSGVLMLIQLIPNALSPAPFPTNLIVLADPSTNMTTVRNGQFTVTPGDWYIGVHNTNSQPVNFDLGVYILVTNAVGDTFDVLGKINDQLAPYYRFESGTSMAAPAISGMLALMQEYLVDKLKLQPSPALMKALLINSSYLTANFYDYQTTKITGNDEGWGLPNITRSLPLSTNAGPIVFFDQSTNGALATGESCTRNIKITAEATNTPLRVTLVWTDPPGNPAAGIKLVNDLDLIVSNRVTGEQFVGNNFPARSQFTQVSTNISETNALTSDIVDNVENVYITGSEDAPLSTDYAIIVKAKRVNVNAVNAHPNGIVQDYALVISSGSVTSTAPLSVVGEPTTVAETNPWVVNLTNGVPMLYQRVGANSPLLDQPNGTDIQWRFYTFTNMPAPTNLTGLTNPPPTNQPYVAIVTFMSPNLSTPRNYDADIDLYVSTNSAITNLDPVAVAGADKSLKRGGTEMILYTNSNMGMVYYIGVKAEDQKAAEFGILAVASDKPFSETDSDGNIVSRAIGVPMDLPDGSPMYPHMTNLICLSTDIYGRNIRRVGVRQRMQHQYVGDLYEALSQGGGAGDANRVWLSNHSDFGSNTVTFDDSGELRYSVHTDGPGNLRNYVGSPATGVWMTTLWDNALGDAGRVTEFSMVIAPRPFDPLDFEVTLHAGGWYFDYIDLPTDVTNLSISVGFVAGDGPVDVYLRKGDFPTPLAYDFAKTGIMAPGDALVVGLTNTPPISGGRWFYGLHNGSAADVTLHIVIRIERSMTPDLITTYVWTNGPTQLVDDARTQSTLFVPDSNPVLATSVGVRLAHDRASDLAITLTSPQGSRVVLFEDRGGTSATGLGLSFSNSATSTTMVYTVFTENTNWNPQPIKFAVPPYGSTNGVLTTNLPVFVSSFETNRAWNYTTNNTTNLSLPYGIYTNGEVVDGWLVLSNLVVTNIVVTNNVTNLVATNLAITNAVGIVRDPTNANLGSNFLTLGNGRLVRDVVTEVGKPYRLSLAYRSQGLTNWWPADTKVNDLVGATNGFETNGVIYTNGWVGMGAWSFDGKNPAQFVELGDTVGNFGTNDFTVELWVKESQQAGTQSLIEKRVNCGPGTAWSLRTMGPQQAGYGCPSFELMDTPNGLFTSTDSRIRIDDGKWHHVAVTRKDTNLMAYVDGVPSDYTSSTSVINMTNGAPTIVGTSVCIGDDDSMPLNGQVDEVDFFRRALSPSEVAAIYKAGALGKYSTHSPNANATVVIDGVTNDVFGNNVSWQTNTITFIASNDVTRIELIGSATSPALDAIKLEELANTNYGNFFLAEESLDAFKGENSLGNWTLNLWDSRTGMASTNNSLLSWELQLTYSSTNVTMVTLTNGVSYTGTVTSNRISYFAIDVPINANYATNMLTNVSSTDSLQLLYNQTGLPTGNLPGDVILIDGAYGTNVLNTTVLPILVPGQRYFLGVNNPNSTNETFRIEVDFDVTTNISAIVLTNGNVFTNTLSTNVVAGAADTNYQYYVYNVSSNATMVTFELFGMTNDLDLVVSKGLPPPTRKNFDYISSSAGANNELITVQTNSNPVPLTPGPWYLGVYAYSTNVSSYKVRVTEWVATLTELTNRIPSTNAISTNLARFFYVDVPANAIAATNILRSAGGPLNLFYSATNLPTSNSVQLLNATTFGRAIISSNTTPVLQPGSRYYLWVVQTNTYASNSFTIEVDFEFPPYVVIPLTNAIPFTNSLATFASDYYSFEVSSNNPTRVQFDVFDATGNVDLYVRTNLPIPTDQNYNYMSVNPSVVPEQIVVTNSQAFTLPPGTWYLAVTNQDSMFVSYTIRASEWDWDTNTVVLANGITYNGTVASNSVAHFAVDVPNLIDAVTNTLTSTSGGELGLLFSQVGLPTGILPGDYNLVTTTTVGGAVLATYPWPASDPELIPGQRYYLTVTNTSGVNAPFTVRVDFESMITVLSNNVPYTNTLTAGGPAIRYYAFDVTGDQPMQVEFDVANNTGNVDLYVRSNLPLPSPANADYASANLGNAPEQVIVTNSPTFTLTRGRWYLAVVNSDAGAVTYTVRALEWDAATNTVVLTNGIGYTVTAPPNALTFFAVDVPDLVDSVTNTLTSNNGNLDLLFSQRGTPYGATFPGVYTLLSTAVTGTSVLATDPWPTSTPPLVQGRRYFLSVNNTNNVSTDFTIRVDFGSRVELLKSGVSYNRSVGTNFVQYYAFDVSTNAAAVLFEIPQMSNDVNLVVRHGRPLPGPLSYDYASANPDTTPESILVTADSWPVALTPGRWYLAVYQPAGQTADFTIRATEWASGGPSVNLPDNGFVAGSLPPHSVRFFSVDVPVNALAVYNHLVCPADPLNLWFNQSTQPIGGQAGDRLVLTGTKDGTLVLTNGSDPSLVNGATYYLTLRNDNAVAEPYMFRVTMEAPISLTNAVAYTNTFAVDGSIQYYTFEVSADATEVAFEILNPDGNVDMVIRQGMPLPTRTSYQVISQNPGTNAESVVLLAGDPTPTPLKAGLWYIGVYSAEGTNQTNAITYSIRAIQETAPGGATIVTLNDGVPYSSVAIPGVSFYTNSEFIYYMFEVTNDEPRVTFNITNATGVPGMLVRWKALPTPQAYDYVAKDSTAGSASVTVWQDANRKSLLGQWFVAVPNWGSTDMNFDITAALHTDRGLRVIDLTGGVPYSAIAGPYGLIDDFGGDVLYRFVITNSDAAVIFNINNAQGDVDLVASQNYYPALDMYDFGSFNLAPIPDGLLIVTNAGLPTLNGAWYLGVYNSTGGQVPFDIMATLLTPPSAFLPVITIQPSATGITFTWPSYPGMQYELDFTADLNQPFTTVTTMIATGTSMSYVGPAPGSGGAQGYYRLRLLGMPGSGAMPPIFP